MNDEQIEQFLTEYGEALGKGDTSRIAACWAVPALVLADQGVRAAATLEEVESVFGLTVQGYHARGYVRATHNVERIDHLTQSLASVDVRWQAYDAEERAQDQEYARYILRTGDQGQPQIHVAIIRPV